MPRRPATALLRFSFFASAEHVVYWLLFLLSRLNLSTVVVVVASAAVASTVVRSQQQRTESKCVHFQFILLHVFTAADLLSLLLRQSYLCMYIDGRSSALNAIVRPTASYIQRAFAFSLSLARSWLLLFVLE